MPKRRQLLLHAFPDVEDQLVAILRWLRDHPQSQCPVIFLVSGDTTDAKLRLRKLVGDYAEQIVVLKKSQLTAIWSYWRSRYVLFTHGLYGFLPISMRQCVINLWHGMPIKSIWRGLGSIKPPQCNWLLSTSPKFSEVLAQASGVPMDRIPVTGLPRNDLLFSDTAAVRVFAAQARVGVERVLLFLPTYRQSKIGYITHDGEESASALSMGPMEVDALRAWLAATRTRMLVKPHPMSVHYGRDDKLSENLWLISDEWLHEQGVMLYEALGQMDALITDTSSVYIDYLALRRPVFFYFPDLERYRETRKFLLEPVEEWLAGPLCRTGQELTAALDQWTASGDLHSERRAHLARQLNPQTTPDSTQRVFDLLFA